jgi:AraC-like DNA-binding protein
MERSLDYEFYQHVPRPVGAMAKWYPSGYAGFRHSHPRAQFLYAESGTMKVSTESGTWIVPPHRAVWFPPNCPHQTGALSELEMRTLYIRPDGCPKNAPKKPCVLQVSPLLRELVRRTAAMPVEYDEQGHDGRIIALLLDEIQWSRIQVPAMPRLQDSRLLAIERAFAANPGDTRSIEEWAELAGASPRTLARLFLREAGMSFRSWREQFRALTAISQLMNGDAITTLASEFGYETAGAFTAMFRRVMGMTPSQFLSEAFSDSGTSSILGTRR